MAQTVEDQIKHAVQQVLGVDPSMIQNDLINLCIAQYNHHGNVIWFSYPFNNEKLDWFEITPDDDGTVTLPTEVDVVRAVKKVDEGGTVPIYSGDQLTSIYDGTPVPGSNENFDYMPDDSSGNRVIRYLNKEDNTTLYVLALKRFVPVSTADYTTISFPLDRAIPALTEFIMDAIRTHVGRPAENKGPAMLAIARDRERQQQQTDVQATPRHPGYTESGGNWY